MTPLWATVITMAVLLLIVLACALSDRLFDLIEALVMFLLGVIALGAFAAAVFYVWSAVLA